MAEVLELARGGVFLRRVVLAVLPRRGGDKCRPLIEKQRDVAPQVDRPGQIRPRPKPHRAAPGGGGCADGLLDGHPVPRSPVALRPVGADVVAPGGGRRVGRSRVAEDGQQEDRQEERPAR